MELSPKEEEREARRQLVAQLVHQRDGEKRQRRTKFKADLNRTARDIAKMFAFVLIAGTCLVVFGIVTSHIHFHDTTKAGVNKEKAYEEACNYVRRKLKCPATAIFPPLTDHDVMVFDGHDATTTQVESYVDSQNGFGALIRNKWRAILKNYGTESFSGKSLDLPTWESGEDFGEWLKKSHYED